MASQELCRIAGALLRGGGAGALTIPSSTERDIAQFLADKT